MQIALEVFVNTIHRKQINSFFAQFEPEFQKSYLFKGIIILVLGTSFLENNLSKLLIFTSFLENPPKLPSTLSIIPKNCRKCSLESKTIILGQIPAHKTPASSGWIKKRLEVLFPWLAPQAFWPLAQSSFHGVCSFLDWAQSRRTRSVALHWGWRKWSGLCGF